MVLQTKNSKNIFETYEAGSFSKFAEEAQTETSSMMISYLGTLHFKPKEVKLYPWSTQYLVTTNVLHVIIRSRRI